MNTPPCIRSGHRAFTLVELLVVIAIIFVLAAILFPVMSKVRTQASSATCVSQIRTVGAALQMYLQEHDNVLPSASPFQSNPFTGQGPYYNRDPRRIQSTFGSYWDAPNAKSWSTTEANMDFDGTLSWPAWEDNRRKAGSPSLLINLPVKIVGESKPRAPTWGKNYLQIEEPNNAPMLTEADDAIAPGAWSNSLPIGPVHGSFRNTLFFDGHVEQVDAAINLRKDDNERIAK